MYLLHFSRPCSLSVRRGAFSTGFVFKYKDSDHGDNMFVKAVHQNLKEEVLESGHLSVAKWMKLVKLKARKYMISKRVKKMKGVTKEHIYAIILYCDFSALCTAFSGTFRKSRPFESLDSIKKRNREYSIWSRLLRETVEYFGQRGAGDGYDKVLDTS